MKIDFLANISAFSKCIVSYTTPYGLGHWKRRWKGVCTSNMAKNDFIQEKRADDGLTYAIRLGEKEDFLLPSFTNGYRTSGESRLGKENFFRAPI